VDIHNECSPVFDCRHLKSTMIPRVIFKLPVAKSPDLVENRKNKPVFRMKRVGSSYTALTGEVATEHIRQYFHTLLHHQEKSHTFVNQLISALQFLHQHVLNQPLRVSEPPRPKKERKLPSILDKSEVQQKHPS
jgi:hypothetical protein